MATLHVQDSTFLDNFLEPLRLDVSKCHALATSLSVAYSKLAKESEDQFLPTPVSDSVLRPKKDAQGRYLAIDIGGTNLRVGFIELQASSPSRTNGLSSQKYEGENPRNEDTSRVRRHLEKSWPIGEQLKKSQAEDLFAWIGACIREVVQDGCEKWPGELPAEIPLGVTFSFPMAQHSLSTATLMTMGKDFIMKSNLELSLHLSDGYNTNCPPSLPHIKITAIANDTVATFVSFFYQLRSIPHRKPVMGLIVGTGTNATIPLAVTKLHPSKRPKEKGEEKIAVNTEWTIKGAAPPLHEHGIVTRWDAKLDIEGSAPGFQPFEYMTAGRYLGELGRIIICDFFTNHLSIVESSLPTKLVSRHGLSTTFLGIISSGTKEAVKQLNEELPPPATSSNYQDEEGETFEWTSEMANAVYKIAKSIQIRASAMVAAAILGLLDCADELALSSTLSNGHPSTYSNIEEGREVEELLVGYTGGCIAHFQDYLMDCQGFLDAVLENGSREGRVRVVLEACHDGGILGAGILAGIVEGMDGRRGLVG